MAERAQSEPGFKGQKWEQWSGKTICHFLETPSQWNTPCAFPKHMKNLLSFIPQLMQIPLLSIPVYPSLLSSPSFQKSEFCLKPKHCYFSLSSFINDSHWHLKNSWSLSIIEGSLTDITNMEHHKPYLQKSWPCLFTFFHVHVLHHSSNSEHIEMMISQPLLNAQISKSAFWYFFFKINNNFPQKYELSRELVVLI